MSPAAHQWLFAAKTLAAAILALLISLWIALPNPYWALATVYIASNPLSGATRSKAIFRVAGTLLGAVAAVVMVPNLAGAPVLLVLAMALWSALCLYVSLLDRTPRSYVFMLAGYTAALIGFPTVDAPDTIFVVALARAEEIILGILCAAVVSSIVFPRTVAPVVTQRLRSWLRDADASARDALQMNIGADSDARRLRLAADIGEIENLATHLAYDGAADRRIPQWISDVQPRMLMLLPILSSISDRLGELASLGGPSRSAAALVERMGTMLTPEHSGDDRQFELLRKDIEEHVEAHRDHRTWRDLIELSLVMRLGDLASIHADCLNLTAATAGDATVLSRPLTYRISDRAAPARHHDYGLAMVSAVVSFATIVSCCAFWILTAWPEGGAAAMMAAVAASLFAAQDNPVPSIIVFAKWAAAAVLVSAVYLFVILPHVHNFETLALVLAPLLLVCGRLMARPETFLIGLSLAINSAAMIGLEPTFKVDAAAFLNTSIAMTVGVGLAAVAATLLRTVGAEWSIWRLSNANRATLVEIAKTENVREDARLTGLMLDRLMLLAPRAKASGHRIPDAIGDLREGFNMLDLRRARTGLTAYSRRRVDAVLMMLKRHYLARTMAAADPLLAAINRALLAVRDEQGASARNTLLGLVGLRRSLFPVEMPLDLPLSPRHLAPTDLEAAQ